MEKQKTLKRIAEEAAQPAIKAALLDELAKCDNKLTEAAALLGISRYTAYRMMRRCGLEFTRELTEK